MFKIITDNIYLTRGDEIEFDINLSEGLFSIGDEIVFSVYKAGKLNKSPLLSKKIEVQNSTETVTIQLTSEDTSIGDMVNHSLIYWYQIRINGNTTVKGFEDNSAPLFVVFPEGVDINE